jgi:GTP cyclohydrolase II
MTSSTTTKGPLILETGFGEFAVRSHNINGDRIVSLVCDDVMSHVPIVRMHSGCLFAHVFHSTHCDCREQFAGAQETIKKHGRGVLLYTESQEGKGHGLDTKIVEMALQREAKLDSVEAFKTMGLEPDVRDYANQIAVLRELRVPKEIYHFSGNPRKRLALTSAGFKILGQFEHCAPLGTQALAERNMKQLKMGYVYTETFPADTKTRGDG